MEDQASPGRVLRFCQKLAKDLGLKFDRWNSPQCCCTSGNDYRMERWNTRILVADLGEGKGWKSRLSIENIFSRKKDFRLDVRIGFLIETNIGGNKGLPLEFVINYERYPNYRPEACTFDVFLSELAKDIQQLVKESPAIVERIIKSKTFTDFSKASVRLWLSKFIIGVMYGLDNFAGKIIRFEVKSGCRSFATSPDFPEKILTEDGRRILEELGYLPLIKQMLEILPLYVTSQFTLERDWALGKLLGWCGLPKTDEITPLERCEKKLKTCFVNEIGGLLVRTECKFNGLREFFIRVDPDGSHFYHWDTKRYDVKRKNKDGDSLVYKREATIE